MNKFAVVDVGICITFDEGLYLLSDSVLFMAAYGEWLCFFSGFVPLSIQSDRNLTAQLGTFPILLPCFSPNPQQNSWRSSPTVTQFWLDFE